jgi:hypothetical protein
MDNGTIPMMIFRAELRNQLALNLGEGIYYPWGTSASNVVNRPLFAWENGNTQLMRIAASGKVGIGLDAPYTFPTTAGSVNVSNYKLFVKGGILTEEVRVALGTTWADYIFAKDYKLPTLAEVEAQIKEKGHLANVPSAAEVKANGIEVGEMAKIQMAKIEELTLYIIEQNKTNETQSKEIAELKALVQNLLERK